MLHPKNTKLRLVVLSGKPVLGSSTSSELGILAPYSTRNQESGIRLRLSCQFIYLLPDIAGSNLDRSVQCLCISAGCI